MFLFLVLYRLRSRTVMPVDKFGCCAGKRGATGEEGPPGKKGKDGDSIIYTYFSRQALRWFRENANGCFYFKKKDDFIWKNEAVIGFKSQSRYHPVNALSLNDPLTAVELERVWCAYFAGKSMLTVKDLDISSNLYVTVVLTFRCTEEIIKSEENIITDSDRAITILEGDIRIFGTTTTSLRITPPRKLNQWNTVFVQWGPDADRSGHVYVGVDKDAKHVTFASTRSSSHYRELHIGGLNQTTFSGIIAYMAALEVYLTETPIPEEIRKLVMEDQHNMIR